MADASSSVQGGLSPQKALKLSKIHLENAHKAADPELTAMFYNEARAALSRMEQPSLDTLLSSDSSQDQSLREEIIYVLNELNDMMATLKQPDTIQADHTNMDDLSDTLSASTELAPSLDATAVNTTVIPRHIFGDNMYPHGIRFKLPECGERIKDTRQLAYCLGLLKFWRLSPDGVLDPTAPMWLFTINKDKNESDRLMALATDVITMFIREGIKDVEFTKEAVILAPVVDKAVYRYLLEQMCNAIERSIVLDSRQFKWLAQVIRDGSTGYLEGSDMIKILGLITERLREIHDQSPDNAYEFSLAMTGVIDAMADTTVEDFDREMMSQFMSGCLDVLNTASDPGFVYQVAYAHQALQHIRDDEAIWPATFHRTRQPFTLVDNTKAIDVKGILQELRDSYEGLDDDSPQEPRGQGIGGLLDYLKHGHSLKRKQWWYPALRMADDLLHAGQFTEFEQLAFGAPCRRNPAFQWGLCQLLKDLAANLEWSTITRLNAVSFLEDIYRNDAVWGEQADIKELVISILTKLSSLPKSVKQAADTTLQQLRTSSQLTEQHTDQATLRSTGYKSYLSNAALSSLGTFSLLDRVQDTLGIESRILRLRKQCLSEQQDAVYVNPRAKVPRQPCNLSRFGLIDNVKEFLRGDRKIYLLLGSSGSGKSTFSHALERNLWSIYERMEGTIPLYVDMSTTALSNKDLIGSCLQKLGFTKRQIQELKIYRKFILICDEYDQLPPSENLDAIKKLNQPGGWHVKVVICCRTELLGSTSLDCFYPTNEECQAQPELFQQVAIEPFNVDQVQDYIKQYASRQQLQWKTDDYLRVFEQDRCLQDLSRNPLLLFLTLEVLPRLVDTQHTLSSKKFNMVEIFDQIVAHWFEHSKSRLGARDPGEDIERLTCGDILQSGIDYLKRLAAAIYKNQGGDPVVEYSNLFSRYKRDEAWKEDFFGLGGSNQIMRKASPLKCCGNKFQFIHPSILEYGLALAVYDPQEFKGATTSKPVLTRRGSTDSAMSFESNDADEETTTVIDQGPDQDSPLGWRSFVNDLSVIRFLEERAQQESMFKQQLMAFVELSKTNKKWRTAAANAITILVGAGISFSGADLRGIQIPGANLSHGIFDAAQLRGADLRKTTLRNVWLYEADLSQAQMKGARLGELPSLLEDSSVCCCAYSPDGRYLGVGLVSGKINVYTTSTWERIRTLDGHSGHVFGIVFSTTGMIISGGLDKVVRLWDIEIGTCQHTLTGHTDQIYGIAFSPQGDQAATGGASEDKTVRLWDVDLGACQHVLSGHGGAVWSVAFSPNGRQVASGSSDKTVRLWDTKDGTLHSIISGCSGMIFSIAFSPQGNLIASGSNDNTVRLWDVESGVCQSILDKQSGPIWSVAFSPLGNLIAAGTMDRLIQLWDVETGVCQGILSGHDGSVRRVVFSPKGDHIASCSQDKNLRLWSIGAGDRHYNIGNHDGLFRSVTTSPTSGMVATRDGKVVRLWDLGIGNCIKSLKGHSGNITGVAFSSAKRLVASGSDDNIVRLWDVDTGVCHVMNGHTLSVTSVAISPRSSLVASGSDDKTIRMWNAEKGECTLTIRQDNCVKSVAFSPTDDLIACSDGKGVHLWDLTGKHVRNFTSHDSHCVVFSPNGDTLASASGDCAVRLLYVKAGYCYHVLIGHGDVVTSITFSSNGDQVASGSVDKSIRLWSVASGQSLAVVKCYQGPVHDLVWLTASGQEYLVAGGATGMVYLWQVSESRGRHDISLRWMSPRRLGLTGATAHNVQGLSDLDMQLLRQRGAIGCSPSLQVTY